MFSKDDALFVNHFYADAVYAPLYYGFGKLNSFSDRRARARSWDEEPPQDSPSSSNQSPRLIIQPWTQVQSEFSEFPYPMKRDQICIVLVPPSL